MYQNASGGLVSGKGQEGRRGKGKQDSGRDGYGRGEKDRAEMEINLRLCCCEILRIRHFEKNNAYEIYVGRSISSMD